MRRLAAAAAATCLAFAGSAAAGGAGAAFAPNDPLAAKQWYLEQDHAFDLWPGALPALPGDGVRVAVVDSGIDGGHPDLAGRVVASKSFVGGSPLTDEQGHGTFVAGEIAASTNNGLGIAGIAFPAKLVVAKVVRSDRTIPLGAETAAIRWAVGQGARVINLSLGGLRDPTDPLRDTYSSAEARAIEYAVRHGTVVVAAVGNADQAPRVPWPFASYPAALPHVIGVSALARDGSVPAFSNRDTVFDDIAAPGQDIFSTLPRRITAARPTCADQGYSDCGPADYVHASGTSFAAPQVSAAAALLLASDPDLRPDQVSAILERTAADANASNGCRRCPLLRDSLTGWGRLDIAAALAALAGPLPPADRFEPNDDAGADAFTLWGRTIRTRPTIDYWDDPVDVYRVRIAAGHRFLATVRGPGRSEISLALWKPGTTSVFGVARPLVRKAKQLVYRAAVGGWYYLEVKVGSTSFGAYDLAIAKR
ncbi:MAG TPA: S8 family serine peptidase [Gaiellaceae bacterium]|nr:S8 family serine peptidase [Gaiellaceae bacterium]